MADRYDPISSKTVVESCSCVTREDIGGAVISIATETTPDTWEELNSLVLTEFHCAICRGLIVAASMANCGHQFCHTCLDQWRQQSGHCPICRVRITVALNCPLVDRFLDNFVESFGEEQMRQVRRDYAGRGWRTVIVQEKRNHVSTGSFGSTY